ncbi:uncharacterized protein LOC143511788 [Brachyhypopomus gauderio]|uniref:uncharacterized protein LOC143511788 n=1 Tax=Brachyhypopomus gauderio TaxID=698409 RepID=UPI00404187D0
MSYNLVSATFAMVKVSEGPSVGRNGRERKPARDDLRKRLTFNLSPLRQDLCVGGEGRRSPSLGANQCKDNRSFLRLNTICSTNRGASSNFPAPTGTTHRYQLSKLCIQLNRNNDHQKNPSPLTPSLLLRMDAMGAIQSLMWLVLRVLDRVLGYEAIRFRMNVFGKIMNCNQDFMKRINIRPKPKEVFREDRSDVIIAFVAVVSRAGTDIEAALNLIPETRPVILVVLHHTFDPNLTAPESRHCVQRNKVFAVDCLYHEDQGLLECPQNSNALRATAEHLKTIKTSPRRLVWSYWVWDKGTTLIWSPIWRFCSPIWSRIRRL